MTNPKMTPQQLIKFIIVQNVAIGKGETVSTEMTAEQVEEAYDELVENDEHWDAEYEARGGEVETGLDSPLSRHYETKAVASRAPNGQWVGWTYWYGGGKHGNPEEIEWQDDAYLLDCVEAEKVVTVRTFAKVKEEL